MTSTKEDENEIKVVSEAETDIIEKYDENCSLNSGTSNPDQQGTIHNNHFRKFMLVLRALIIILF